MAGPASASRSAREVGELEADSFFVRFLSGVERMLAPPEIQWPDGGPGHRLPARDHLLLLSRWRPRPVSRRRHRHRARTGQHDLAEPELSRLEGDELIDVSCRTCPPARGPGGTDTASSLESMDPWRGHVDARRPAAGEESVHVRGRGRARANFCGLIHIAARERSSVTSTLALRPKLSVRALRTPMAPTRATRREARVSGFGCGPWCGTAADVAQNAEGTQFRGA
jgi:hypothetical protein